MNNAYVYICVHQNNFILNPSTPKIQLISNITFQESLEQNLWKTVLGLIGKPGATLVDFVSKLWTMSTTALQTIKDGVTSFVDGIKAAGEFIVSNVLLPIVESLRNFFVKILETILYTISTQIPFSVSPLSNGIQFVYLGTMHQIILSIDASLDLIFSFDGMEEFRILTPFLFPRIEVPETLSILSAYTKTITFYTLMSFGEFIWFTLALEIPSIGQYTAYGPNPLPPDATWAFFGVLTTLLLQNLALMPLTSPEEARWFAYHNRGSAYALSFIQAVLLVLISPFLAVPALEKWGSPIATLLMSIGADLADPDIGVTLPNWFRRSIGGMLITLITYFGALGIRVGTDLATVITSLKTIAKIPAIFAYLTLVTTLHLIFSVIWTYISKR